MPKTLPAGSRIPYYGVTILAGVMSAKNRQLDVLLIAEEHTGEDAQAFGEFDSWIRESSSSFSYSVKQEVEQMFGLEDLLRPAPGNGPGERTTTYHLSLPHRPSLALCDLATVLKQAGHSVGIIDNFRLLPWRFEQMKDVISDHSPRLIGISTTFLLVPRVIRDLVQKLRDLAPDAKIALGGQTVREQQELHACADFAVFGEGEDPILGILEVLDGKRDVDSVANIAYLDGDGNLQYATGARQSALVDVVGVAYRARMEAKMPIPDWTLYGRNRDCVYSTEFSRGCKYNCFYCTYDRGRVRRAPNAAGLESPARLRPRLP